MVEESEEIKITNGFAEKGEREREREREQVQAVVWRDSWELEFGMRTKEEGLALGPTGGA